MDTLLKKLNLKENEKVLLVNVPKNLSALTDAFKAQATVKTKTKASDEFTFTLAFVTKQAEVDELAATITPVTKGDAAVWFAYPKGTSKNYKCEFNRDTGWSKLGELGFEPVRMVAIDEDWSALRFRRAEFIKTMKRAEKHALSAAGKAKTKAK
ncbi:MAG: hypothetical protein JST84_14825 [Acidobacteria bacterium]|nr:hypothetical protein [Acidobacteriota bacterium]